MEIIEFRGGMLIMNTKKGMLDLEEAYGQTPACALCGACLIDGPAPDAEVVLFSGFCEE